jgi:deoxycytidine triphosphate deaminase
MQLTEQEIRSRITIENAAETSYRSISYDVRVGLVVGYNDGELKEQNDWVLRPQGVVEVISKEKITLPSNVAAFAMVRTRLCNEGILPLNIGIVDPLYSGPVSTTLLNFSKVDYPLREGEVFLRLTFHECASEVKAKDASLAEVERNYVQERVKKIAKFDETFLNLRASIQEEASPIFWKYLAIVGVSLAVLGLLLNLSVAWVGRQLWNNRDDLRSGLVQELRTSISADAAAAVKVEQELERLRVANETLRKDVRSVEQLRKQVSDLQNEMTRMRDLKVKGAP